MEREMKLDKFAKYAWFVLFFNLLVILWGVFLRASLSGDGCGEHWITCGGEFIPSAPELKTQIEFFHRITSSLAGVIVIALVISAIVKWVKEKSSQNKLLLKMSVLSLFFIIVEGILGGLLVLTGNTAANWTPTRPFWMAGHLLNTFTLVAVIALTAWFASGGKTFSLLKADRKAFILIWIGIIGIFIIGMSGSIAALSSMIFPSSTLAEGIAKDFSATSHYILNLRPLHPIFAILFGLYLAVIAGWMRSKGDGDFWITRWANILTILLGVQLMVGMITLLALAPIVLQLTHLLLADLIWITFVLLVASFLGKKN